MTQEQTKNRRHRSRRGRRPLHARELPDIFFCGDPHGGFDQINEAARLYHPDAMVILGDLQPPAPLEEVLEEALSYTDIWWIPGNHDTDTDEFYDRLWRSALRDHNLHGRSVMIHGVRIAGLGGVFRGQVWMPDDPPNYFSPSSFMRRVGTANIWRGGVPRRHRSTIFPSVYNNLLHQKADILVTHEAPACHKKGFCAIDKLARSLGARWMFHGHQHEDREYCIDSGIATRAVGYRGVVNLRGEVVISAKLDPREAAPLHDAFDWEECMCTEKGKILVRDEDGLVHIVPECEGIVPAILPPCPDLVPLCEEEARARRAAREAARSKTHKTVNKAREFRDCSERLDWQLKLAQEQDRWERALESVPGKLSTERSASSGNARPSPEASSNTDAQAKGEKRRRPHRHRAKHSSNTPKNLD